MGGTKQSVLPRQVGSLTESWHFPPSEKWNKYGDIRLLISFANRNLTECGTGFNIWQLCCAIFDQSTRPQYIDILNKKTESFDPSFHHLRFRGLISIPAKSPSAITRSPDTAYCAPISLDTQGNCPILPH